MTVQAEHLGADVLERMWRKVHQQRPLVQCITNYVSMDFMANVLLASGECSSTGSKKHGVTQAFLQHAHTEQLRIFPYNALVLNSKQHYALKDSSYQAGCLAMLELLFNYNRTHRLGGARSGHRWLVKYTALPLCRSISSYGAFTG